jgi:hypothetical protein
MNARQTLEQAKQAIRSGDRQAGRKLLAQILYANPDDVSAWVWMSDTVDSESQRRECLQRALALDPANQAARSRLVPVQSGSDGSMSDSPNHHQTGHNHPEGVLAQPGPECRVTDKSAAASRQSPLGEAQPSPMRTESAAPVPGHRVAFHDPLTEELRARGHHNVMAAGALTLTMVCGLILLIVIATTVVPQAQERMRPTLEPVLYTATLWCLPCEQANSPIVLWEKVGDGDSRGSKVGELAHDTPVSVLAEEWSEPEQRTYLKITVDGQKGWLPEEFIKQ